MQADWSLMRDRQFARLFCARTASMGGSAFAPIALSFGVLHLPGGDTRTLILCQKISQTPTAYPRNGGKIAKSPLK